MRRAVVRLLLFVGQKCLRRTSTWVRRVPRGYFSVRVARWMRSLRTAMAPPIPLDPSGLPECELRVHGACCVQLPPSQAARSPRPKLIVTWNQHAVWRVSEPNLSACKQLQFEWRTPCGAHVESRVIMPSRNSVRHAVALRELRWLQMQNADALLKRAVCNASTAASSVASLKADVVNALHWLYRQEIPESREQPLGKGLSRALLRLEAQGQTWRPTIDSQFGPQRYHLIERLIAKCAYLTRAVGFDEFVWILTLLMPSLEFAVTLHNASRYGRNVRAAARLENRTPAVCGGIGTLVGPPMVVINATVR